MPRRGPQKAVPEGYVCKACNKPGHWVFDCSKRQKKRPLDEPKKAPESEAASDDDTFKIKKPITAENFSKKKIAKLAAPTAPGLVKLFREPTAEDIRKAKEIMPIINPKAAPKCNCGEPARARKNKKKESPAFGHMFWWCPKAKDDETRCQFVRKADVI